MGPFSLLNKTVIFLITAHFLPATAHTQIIYKSIDKTARLPIPHRQPLNNHQKKLNNKVHTMESPVTTSLYYSKGLELANKYVIQPNYITRVIESSRKRQFLAQ